MNNEKYVGWLDSELAGVNAAGSLEDLAAVAFSVLNKMPRPTGIVCGPVTAVGGGNQDVKLAEIGRAICLLRVCGYSVFDQRPLESGIQRLSKAIPPDALCGRLHSKLFVPLFEFAGLRIVFFLPKWETSVHGPLEMALVRRLKKQIVFLDEV